LIRTPRGLCKSRFLSYDFTYGYRLNSCTKLKQVRALLATTGKVATKLAERKTKEAPVKAGKAAKTAKTKKRRVLSPEARKRIADAQRKRWAAQKSKA
jgi:hypothetical protein